MAIVRKIPAERNLRKKQVAAYVRVSSEMEEQDGSFETQIEYYEKKIKGNPDWEFAGVYAEKKSGTSREGRKEFNRMIKDVKLGKIDLILCKSISRWGRNMVEAVQAIRELMGYRVNVVLEQEGLDTRTPGIAFQLNLAASVAQSESESISENQKWVYKKLAEQGVFRANPGTYFGYNTDDRSFHPDENAKYVRGMFKHYLRGETYAEIADWLNDQGVKTRRGNPFSGSNIKSILTNEVYVGDVQFGKHPSRNVITGELDEYQVKKYVREHHEGLVDRATWDAVQKKITSEAKHRSRS